MFRQLRLAWIFMMLGLVSACSNGPNSKYEDFGERINTEGFGHKFPQPENEDELVMGPGDVLDMQIANSPDLSSAQPIRVEGVITAPFVGDVKVAGLTPTQIRDKLAVLLTPYITDVSVQVIPISIQSKVIYVYSTDRLGGLIGGSVPVGGDMTLIDLITILGGVSPGADDCHVKVTRGDPRHPKTLNINVRDIILNGYTAGNIRMRPDDMVYMPPAFYAKVTQFLNQVTSPIRVLSSTLSSASTPIFLITEGTLPRGRFNGNSGF